MGIKGLNRWAIVTLTSLNLTWGGAWIQNGREGSRGDSSPLCVRAGPGSSHARSHWTSHILQMKTQPYGSVHSCHRILAKSGAGLELRSFGGPLLFLIDTTPRHSWQLTFGGGKDVVTSLWIGRITVLSEHWTSFLISLRRGQRHPILWPSALFSKTWPGGRFQR